MVITHTHTPTHTYAHTHEHTHMPTRLRTHAGNAYMNVLITYAGIHSQHGSKSSLNQNNNQNFMVLQLRMRSKGPVELPTSGTDTVNFQRTAHSYSIFGNRLYTCRVLNKLKLRIPVIVYTYRLPSTQECKRSRAHSSIHTHKHNLDGLAIAKTAHPYTPSHTPRAHLYML